MPSSCVTLKVICSGLPSGKSCRHMWTPPPVSAEKYIHLLSGDQAASVHCDGAGPTGFPRELPSNGTSRQGSHALKPISITMTCCPLGERRERWAIPFSGG